MWSTVEAGFRYGTVQFTKFCSQLLFCDKIERNK